MTLKYEVVVFGATGFTGRLAALYLAKQYNLSIRWAIAGRSRQKLEALKHECAGIPGIIVADSSDEAALNVMVAQTKVVCTFAGPFARYGSKLVAACVSAGVHYCDITGEVDWVREMIVKYDDAAKTSGARIVNFCGHDSLPWDMMTFMLSKKLRSSGGGELRRVEFWDQIKSSPSGGTLETALGKEKKSEELAVFGYDPLVKLPASPEPSTYKLTKNNVRFLDAANSRKGHLGVRSMFVMADCNASVVKRSNALNQYGRNVVYREGISFKQNFEAFLHLLVLTLFGLLFYFRLTRYLLRKFVLPKVGEGPSTDSMKKCFLNVTGVATSTNGEVAKATIRFFVDPGYMDTARMCVEAGLTIALNEAKLHNKRGGVLTPATCQGEAVLDRLVKTGTAFEYH